MKFKNYHTIKNTIKNTKGYNKMNKCRMCVHNGYCKYKLVNINNNINCEKIDSELLKYDFDALELALRSCVESHLAERVNSAIDILTNNK